MNWTALFTDSSNSAYCLLLGMASNIPSACVHRKYEIYELFLGDNCRLENENTVFAVCVAYLLCFRRELQVTGGLESQLGL